MRWHHVAESTVGGQLALDMLFALETALSSPVFLLVLSVALSWRFATWATNRY